VHEFSFIDFLPINLAVLKNLINDA